VSSGRLIASPTLALVLEKTARRSMRHNLTNFGWPLLGLIGSSHSQRLSWSPRTGLGAEGHPGSVAVAPFTHPVHAMQALNGLSHEMADTQLNASSVERDPPRSCRQRRSIHCRPQAVDTSIHSWTHRRAWSLDRSSLFGDSLQSPVPPIRRARGPYCDLVTPFAPSMGSRRSKSEWVEVRDAGVPDSRETRVRMAGSQASPWPAPHTESPPPGRQICATGHRLIRWTSVSFTMLRIS
jgi:hypothetical protein